MVFFLLYRNDFDTNVNSAVFRNITCTRNNTLLEMISFQQSWAVMAHWYTAQTFRNQYLHTEQLNFQLWNTPWESLSLRFFG